MSLFVPLCLCGSPLQSLSISVAARLRCVICGLVFLSADYMARRTATGDRGPLGIAIDIAIRYRKKTEAGLKIDSEYR
uniref:Uncharacterized protein n=1 Tax=Candidatus Kentrum sp. FM TaxID=2126340 RepID=A0A450TL99_9GAMM|nr:MAG: hypothetical protein BECKFM1743A_GA0114220_104737 [Candidatus Kentron sp. FM]